MISFGEALTQSWEKYSLRVFHWMKILKLTILQKDKCKILFKRLLESSDSDNMHKLKSTRKDSIAMNQLVLDSPTCILIIELQQETSVPSRKHPLATFFLLRSLARVQRRRTCHRTQLNLASVANSCSPDSSGYQYHHHHRFKHSFCNLLHNSVGTDMYVGDVGGWRKIVGHGRQVIEPPSENKRPENISAAQQTTTYTALRSEISESESVAFSCFFFCAVMHGICVFRDGIAARIDVFMTQMRD